jgi:hypothetical protein
MTIDSRATKWGYGFIIFGLLIFACYWWLLLQPIQNAFVERNLLLMAAGEKPKFPSLFLFIFFGLLVGAVFGVLTTIGFALTKPGWFGIIYQAELGDVLEEKGAWIWTAAWAVLFAVFTVLWRGDI